MSLRYLCSYMYYISEARSEYYVHSPFVYQMMTQCIKKRHFLWFDTTEKLLKRFRSFMADEKSNIIVLENEKDIVQYKDYEFATSDILFIKKPHSTHAAEISFDTLCQRKDISLSIDLFHVGIIFPHRDMEKEHFILKYL